MTRIPDQLSSVADLSRMNDRKTAWPELSEPPEQTASSTACSNQVHVGQTINLLCPLHQLKRFQ